MNERATPEGSSNRGRGLFASDCKRGEWVFGDGTRQQSSTMFVQNGTLFILAQVAA